MTAGLADLATQPGRVDETPRLAVQFDQRVHRIDGGARHIVHHRPLVTGQPVQQRALADVGLADQRDAPRSTAPARVDLGDLRQLGQHMVEQIGDTAAVHGADRVRLPQPQRPQFGGIGFPALAVDLVGRQIHRLAGALQLLGRGLIRGGGPGGGVDHHDDRVGGLHGHRGLLGDLLLQTLRIGFPPAGVLHHEAAARPVGVIGHPVAGYPGDVLHHRFPAPEDPVHQRRLAHVGPPDDGHHRRRGEFLLIGVFVENNCFPVAFVEPGTVLGHRLAPTRCCTRSCKWAITWSWSISLVSTITASSAGRSGDTARVESRWSRRCTSASTAA